MIGASPSDSLMSYPGDSLGESYPIAEMQSVYFIAPINQALEIWGVCLLYPGLRRNKKYVGEASCSMKKRVYEYRRVMKISNDRNAFVKSYVETYNFYFKDFKMLVNMHNKQRREIFESSIISNYNPVKQYPGFSTYLVKLNVTNLNKFVFNRYFNRQTNILIFF